MADEVRRGARNRGQGEDGGDDEDDDGEEGGDDDDDDYGRYLDLEFAPSAALDLTYEDDANGVGDMVDLGVRIGKMRITERIGGLFRSAISEEVRARERNTIKIKNHFQPLKFPPLRPLLA